LRGKLHYAGTFPVCLFIFQVLLRATLAGRPAVKLSHKYSGALQNISFFPPSHKSDWKMYKIFNK